MTNQTDANDWFTMIAIGNQTPKEPKKVPNYGGVSLDEDETAALSLPTKFATLSKITMNNVQYENLLCNTKTRWNRMTKGSPKEQLEAIEEDPESENPSDEQQILENLTREIYNPETKTQDLTKLKATDMKHNPRLHLPPPRPPQEEVALATKDHMWTNTVRVYKTDNCNEFGDQTETNMTKQEARGIKKLLKRQSNGEFVISQTDKSNKNSISTNESYIEQGLVHCSKDHVASWKDVEYSKDLVLHHTKALCSVFQVGQS